MAYDKNKDYQAEIDKAVSEKNYKSAAELEQQRNEKIKGEGITGYQPTNQYGGYIGKVDGIGSGMPGAQKPQGGFFGGDAPSYVNKYQGQIDAITRNLLEREAFSYDAEKDPSYQQYKKTYTREGERAMQDAIGDVSARTGGLGSSYAATAGTQANDYFMGQLADKVPELRQLAYSMYRDQSSDKRADLDMLRALESGDFEKFANAQAQWNVNNERGYRGGRDQVEDARYDTKRQDELARQQIDDGRYEEETKYNQGQDARTWEEKEGADAYNKAMDRWEKTGVLDEAGAKVIGLPTGTQTSDYQFSLAKQAQAAVPKGTKDKVKKDPLPPKPLREYAQLGKAAQGIASKMSALNAVDNAAWFATEIEKALDSKSITEPEADLLLKMLNY